MTRVLILLASLFFAEGSFALLSCDDWRVTHSRGVCIELEGDQVWWIGQPNGLGVGWMPDLRIGEFRSGRWYGEIRIWNGVRFLEDGTTWTYEEGVACINCSPTADQLDLVKSAERKLENAGAGEYLESIRTKANPMDQLVSTGTGFIVNQDFVVTADHVLRKNDQGEQCGAVSIVYRKDEYEAKIVDGDPANDLGLLKLSKPIPSIAKLRNDPDLRLGETAVNYGFPLFGELSSSAKVTSGAVNSLAGYNNNSAFIQYDAASQFGNSGGPVLDASGNIIGVVSSKMDDAENQLVNFATKSTILEGFLRANKVPFEKADLGEKLELPDIAEKAEAFTVLVGCWE